MAELINYILKASNRTDPYPIPYNYPEWIPWIIFTVALVLIFLSSIAFIICMRDPRKNTIFPSLVTLICLTVTGTAVMLIPIDIFTVSQIYDPSIVYAILMRGLYYGFIFFVWQIFFCITNYFFFLQGSWGFLFLFTFFLVPFAYFYYEESDPDVL